VALRYTHLADSHKREVSQEVNARMEEWLAGSGGEPAVPAALVAAVGALSFGEKAALLDLAVQEQAPAAAAIEVAG
jgi:hypothetical protein